MKENIILKDLKLYRCTIIDEDKKYFIGKDVFNNKLYIRKNRATQNYKIKDNYSFHATIVKEGHIIKKDVLYVISSKEYEELFNKEGMTFKVNDNELLQRIQNVISI